MLVNETNAETTPLYKMNPLSRFSDRATDYAKYRPSYAEETIPIILKGLGNPSSLVAVDVGAGTGISSRLLAQRGVRVLAIEPNPAMRDTAAPHPFVEFREGTAEATNLPDASVDLVTCFQAFHWFDPEPTLVEFHRILKRSGQLAVVWNDRDQDDEFTSNYIRLIQLASNHHAAESRLGAVDPLLANPLFTDIHCHSFSHRQELDLEGLMGCTMSFSYIPREGKAQQQLIADLTQLYEHNCNENGFVYLTYCTSVYLAHPRPTIAPEDRLK